ncbi:ABC transporter substrate-binding protein [Schumannella soli]|uniref:ABC transporter substrate-binding protein n=2 Tax=Schumannella soli TaxID=2590779 RepID=A0A506Y7A7_9MICO|nr:ABC transporter substrate-binding protein [Schumannella soli]
MRAKCAWSAAMSSGARFAARRSGRSKTDDVAAVPAAEGVAEGVCSAGTVHDPAPAPGSCGKPPARGYSLTGGGIPSASSFNRVARQSPRPPDAFHHPAFYYAERRIITRRPTAGSPSLLACRHALLQRRRVPTDTGSLARRIRRDGAPLHPHRRTSTAHGIRSRRVVTNSPPHRNRNTMKKHLARASAVSLVALVAVGLAGCATGSGGSGDAGDTVYFGVSSATTGQYAQYGDQFKKAFDLAVKEVNADGGIDGKKVALKYEDSQSDPKQSVTVAQKFVADQDVILAFGDYASSASIPASPIYTAGKLVQYGYNNSNPDFTAKGSQYQWSTAITTTASYTWTADYIKKQGVKSVGVTYLNTADWGIPAYQAFEAEAKKIGLKITDAEGVLDSSDDYRPSLSKIVATKPDAIAHIGYGPDAAKIVNQLRSTGYDGTFYGGQDEESFDATPEAEGSVIGTEFVETNPDAGVQKFVKAFKKAYPSEEHVTLFEAGAYDALHVAVAAAKAGGTTREGILKGFQELKNVPSVVYGEISFDQKTRRVADPKLTPVVLKDGSWSAIEK